LNNLDDYDTETPDDNENESEEAEAETETEEAETTEEPVGEAAAKEVEQLAKVEKLNKIKNNMRMKAKGFKRNPVTGGFTFPGVNIS
jgi:hypothetical protein